MYQKIELIKQYFANPWIKYSFWLVIVLSGFFLIALISNYLTVIVFNIK